MLGTDFCCAECFYRRRNSRFLRSACPASIKRIDFTVHAYLSDKVCDPCLVVLGQNFILP